MFTWSKSANYTVRKGGSMGTVCRLACPRQVLQVEALPRSSPPEVFAQTSTAGAAHIGCRIGHLRCSLWQETQRSWIHFLWPAWEYPQLLNKKEQLKRVRSFGTKLALESLELDPSGSYLALLGISKFPSEHVLWTADLHHIGCIPPPQVLALRRGALLALK